jgi:hypothetical protein
MSARRLAGGLGLAGGLIGVAAGLTQAIAGDRIPQWSGDKQAPLALGLLTVALSLVAVLAAVLQHRTGLTAGQRAACALGLAGPGLLCLTTVGRLWYLPAVLLIVAGALTIESWHDTAAAVATGRWRVLLGALGCCQLLMSATAAPAPMVLGALGGIALLAAAWADPRPQWRLWALVVAGTVPFAVLAWTAIAPLLVTVEAFVIAAARKPVAGQQDRSLS